VTGNCTRQGKASGSFPAPQKKPRRRADTGPENFFSFIVFRDEEAETGGFTLCGFLKFLLNHFRHVNRRRTFPA
jgi:hypothetical protein